VEVAKAMGAKVIAAASSQEKLEFCRSIGADEGICYAEEDLKKRAKALSQGGVDVVVDPVGGAYSEAALRALAWEGRHLVIGFAAGDIPKIPLNLVLLKSCQLVGVFWGALTMRDPAGKEEVLRSLGQMFAEGKVRPRIGATYPLAQAAEALEAVAAREAKGKLILIP
jgi:NADPH2:quinone reductase